MSKLFFLLKEIQAKNLLIISNPEFVEYLTQSMDIVSYFEKIYISDDSLAYSTTKLNSLNVSEKIVKGSLLTPKELHQSYNLNENIKSWHGDQCEICENITCIYENLPDKIDLTIVDCSEFKKYFDLVKVIDKLDVIFLVNSSKLFLDKLDENFEQVLKHKDYLIFKKNLKNTHFVIS